MNLNSVYSDTQTPSDGWGFSARLFFQFLIGSRYWLNHFAVRNYPFFVYLDFLTPLFYSFSYIMVVIGIRIRTHSLEPSHCKAYGSYSSNLLCVRYDLANLNVCKTNTEWWALINWWETWTSCLRHSSICEWYQLTFFAFSFWKWTPLFDICFRPTPNPHQTSRVCFFIRNRVSSSLLSVRVCICFLDVYIHCVMMISKVAVWNVVMTYLHPKSTGWSTLFWNVSCISRELFWLISIMVIAGIRTPFSISLIVRVCVSFHFAVCWLCCDDIKILLGRSLQTHSVLK